MNQGYFSNGCSNYKNHDKIIPNKGSPKYFEVNEIEIYKLLFY